MTISARRSKVPNIMLTLEIAVLPRSPRSIRERAVYGMVVAYTVSRSCAVRVEE